MLLPVFTRALLNRIFGTKSLNLEDLRQNQAELEALESEMRTRVQRIPMTTDDPSYQNNDGFNIWAKMLLWSMGGMFSTRMATYTVYEMLGLAINLLVCPWVNER